METNGKRTPLTRDEALAGWHQAQRATQRLENFLFQLRPRSDITIASLREAIEAGALPEQMRKGWGLQLIGAGNPQALVLVLQATDSLPLAERQAMLMGAVKAQNPDLLLPLLPNTPTNMIQYVLGTLVSDDQVELASAMLRAGVPPEADKDSPRLGERVRSARMFDLLLAHGYQPRMRDLTSAALLGGMQWPPAPAALGQHTPSDPQLLDHMLQKGAPISEEGHPGNVLAVLLREKYRQCDPDLADKQIACARLLLRAGAQLPERHHLELPDLFVLRQAGMAPEALLQAWRERPKKPLDDNAFWGDGRLAKRDKLIDEAVRWLLLLNQQGVSVEALWEAGNREQGHPGNNWHYAFVAAGCALDATLAKIEKQAGEAFLQKRALSLMERNTAVAPGKPRAPRL